MICTDHFSLKYILDQRSTMIPQQIWVSKLFGYDFQVEYQQGKLNTVANALSCRYKEGAKLNAISGTSFAAYDTLRDELQSNTEAIQIQAQIVACTVPAG
jgi:hypothetical protein